MNEATDSPKPVNSYFKGDRLELSWRYAYRPEFVPLLLNYLGLQNGMSILDVGCGSAFLSRLMAKSLSEVQIIGIEADEKMLSLAEQMLARDGVQGQVTLQKGDAYDLPFADETFDLVTSQTVL